MRKVIRLVSLVVILLKTDWESGLLCKNRQNTLKEEVAAEGLEPTTKGL